MQTINYIIIEDEPLAQEALIELFKNYPNFNCIGQFYDGIEAQSFLLVNTPYLVLLDIDIPSINGLDLLRSLNKHLNVIITTAHRDYAADCFDLYTLDFITKPISPLRLDIAINKVLEKINLTNNFENLKLKLETITNNQYLDYIIVKNMDGNDEIIVFTDIIYITKDINYVQFNCRNDRKVETLGSLEHYKNKLSENNFLQIHKSFIVSVNAIIERSKKSLIMSNNKTIEISRTYIDEVNKRLNKLN